MERIPLKAALLALCGAVAAPAQAEQCAAGGVWTIDHGNGAVARVKIIQQGSALVGSGREGDNTGAVDGRISGRDVNFEIDWSNGHVGVYDGSISAGGRLRGVNFDKTAPGSQTNWSVRRTFSCLP